MIFVIQNDIFLNGTVAGKAETERKGLYYQFSCVCSIPEDVPYRIVVQCGDKRVDLGTCIPCGDGFGLRTRVPVKYLGEGKMNFCVRKKNQDTVFLPIEPDQPFELLEQICRSRLVTQNNQVGICINPESVPQGSGLNP